MREGEIICPAPGERITCIRSGQDGGAFIFEMELGPGVGGPPTHTHDEGDEHIEVLEGQVVFRVNGKKVLLSAGSSLTLTPKDAHTFWNPSKSQRVRARVTCGPRFERFIAQPNLTAMLMYITYVDPGASRPARTVTKLLASIVGWFGRVRGVQLVGVSTHSPRLDRPTPEA